MWENFCGRYFIETRLWYVLCKREFFILLFFFSRRCFKYFIHFTLVFIKFHYSSNVTASITIIWRWPYCYLCIIETRFIAFVYLLMCSYNQIYFIFLLKFLNNFFTKKPTSSSRAIAPRFDLIWVWPHKVTHRSFVRDLLFSIYFPYIIDCVNFWAQSTMYG